jgi:hypothetical protein
VTPIGATVRKAGEKLMAENDEELQRVRERLL